MAFDRSKIHRGADGKQYAMVKRVGPTFAERFAERMDDTGDSTEIEYLRELMLILENTVFSYDEHLGSMGWRAQKADEAGRKDAIRALRLKMEGRSRREEGAEKEEESSC